MIMKVTSLLPFTAVVMLLLMREYMRFQITFRSPESVVRLHELFRYERVKRSGPQILPVLSARIIDVTVGRDPKLAARLARGIFATLGVYPAIVRFGNADPKANSDFKADVRSLSFSVDLTRDGAAVPGANVGRQDFSLQNATTLLVNDSPAFLAIMKLLTAANPVAGLWSLPFSDKLRENS